MECDTSDQNCAGYIVQHPDLDLQLPVPLFRPLHDFEIGLGSTLRELAGYVHSLRAADRIRPLQDEHVLMLVGSLSSVFLLAKGGSQTLDADGRLALMLATEALFLAAEDIGCRGFLELFSTRRTFSRRGSIVTIFLFPSLL